MTVRSDTAVPTRRIDLSITCHNVNASIMYGTFEIAAASWQTDNIVRSEKGIIEQRAIKERIASMYFYSAPQCLPQCSHCKRCTSYGNSVCLSVCPSNTLRYCVKKTARSTVQFALSDSRMCLVLQKSKNIPQGRPLPPEILARTHLPPPGSSES